MRRYKKVKISDELPVIGGYYYTNCGELLYDKKTMHFIGCDPLDVLSVWFKPLVPKSTLYPLLVRLREGFMFDNEISFEFGDGCIDVYLYTKPDNYFSPCLQILGCGSIEHDEELEINHSKYSLDKLVDLLDTVCVDFLENN